MKFCTYCGSAIDGTPSFCPNCGAKIEDTSSASDTFGGERVDSVFGTDTTGGHTDTRDHTPSKGVAVISFLFPVIGLILYFVNKDTKPGKAESALKGLLACLTFNIPIAGLILYFVWKNEKPDYAKIAGTWAVIGVVFGIVSFVASFVFGIIAAMLEVDGYAAFAAASLLI